MNDSSIVWIKNRWYVQSFNTEWLCYSQFQGWLEQVVDNKYSARCKICDCIFKQPNKSALIKHMNTSEHNKNVMEPNSVHTIKVGEQSHSTQVAESELSIAAFLQSITYRLPHLITLQLYTEKLFLIARLPKIYQKSEPK